MRLYLLRHGIAEDSAPSGGDVARRLTQAGRSRMRTQAAGMRALGLTFEVILTSAAVRAAQTAEIVAAAWANGPAPRELDALAPGVPAAETLQALRPFLRRRSVLAVGHEPGLSRLAALVLTGSSDGLRIRLKKGGLIALDVQSFRPRTGAELRFLAAPKQMRALG